MIFAVDLDGTYGAAPILWRRFCLDARADGHKVFCVTARPESNRSFVEQFVGDSVHEVFLTDYHQKREFMEEQGIFIDVWIDDNPHAICSAENVVDNIEVSNTWRDRGHGAE